MIVDFEAHKRKWNWNGAVRSNIKMGSIHDMSCKNINLGLAKNQAFVSTLLIWNELYGYSYDTPKKLSCLFIEYLHLQLT